MSMRGDMLDAFANRVATVTAANGYSTDVKKVYADKIRMGLILNPYQLPAVFIFDVQDTIQLIHGQMLGSWEFDIQLWHNKVGDVEMANYVRDVMKSIFANSPTATRVDAFRAIHPQIVEAKPLSIASDLNMIDANRISEIRFMLSYRTTLFNM